MDKDLDESNLKDKFEKSCENKTTKLQFKFGIQYLPPKSINSPGFDLTKVAQAFGEGYVPLAKILDHSLVVGSNLHKSLKVVEVEVQPPKMKTLGLLSVSS